jgi:hypothetical protein
MEMIRAKAVAQSDNKNAFALTESMLGSVATASALKFAHPFERFFFEFIVL